MVNLVTTERVKRRQGIRRNCSGSRDRTPISERAAKRGATAGFRRPTRRRWKRFRWRGSGCLVLVIGQLVGER